MNKIQKIKAAFITATVILSLTACEKSQASLDAPVIETGSDMEQAVKELDEYCAGHPVCIRLDSNEYPDKYSVGKVEFSDNGLVFYTGRTRKYFEDLDKESSLEDIVADIGSYGVKGSGIIYYVWKLNDGTEAHVVFDSKGKIAMIYIIGDDYSERIYKREY